MSRKGERLVEAMQEALDHSEGEIELRTSRIPVVPVRETISADEIRETRKGFGMSQGVFAMTIGVSRKTVEAWEYGKGTPSGPASRNS
ncbi:MAG: helix-turn-helix domain-containing protein [Oscillospiraceae bacterium]|nr:helix-turn-helix domain-containing protein [Oscillospiraceae bacterium]